LTLHPDERDIDHETDEEIFTMKWNIWPVSIGLVICSLLTGCDTGTKASDIEGTYVLAEATNGVNTATPPAVNGYVTLADGTYTIVLTAFGQTISDTGTYTISGSTITFVPSSGPSTDGELSDGNKTLTVTTAGITLTFTKS
jgi:hypothetical protein